MTKWQLQEAKNKLSDLVKLAKSKGPQLITVRGEDAAVVLSAEAYQALVKPKESLASFFRSSPLHGVTLDVERTPDTGRDVDL